MRKWVVIYFFILGLFFNLHAELYTWTAPDGKFYVLSDKKKLEKIKKKYSVLKAKSKNEKSKEEPIKVKNTLKKRVYRGNITAPYGYNSYFEYENVKKREKKIIFFRRMLLIIPVLLTIGLVYFRKKRGNSNNKLRIILRINKDWL